MSKAPDISYVNPQVPQHTQKSLQMKAKTKENGIKRMRQKWAWHAGET
jgi:hypothetical protein